MSRAGMSQANLLPGMSYPTACEQPATLHGRAPQASARASLMEEETPNEPRRADWAVRRLRIISAAETRRRPLHAGQGRPVVTHQSMMVAMVTMMTMMTMMTVVIPPIAVVMAMMTVMVAVIGKSRQCGQQQAQSGNRADQKSLHRFSLSLRRTRYPWRQTTLRSASMARSRLQLSQRSEMPMN